MEQLIQRVKLRYDIPPMSEQELSQYHLFRLSTARRRTACCFLPQTFPIIYNTAGAPRA